MPRDNQGNYSLPSSYLAVTGEDATATQHNAPLEDLASAVSASLPVNGAKAMTGPIKLVDGTVSAPSATFNSDPTTGYYKTTDGFGVAVGGTKVAEFGANGLIVGSGFSAGDVKLTYKTTADAGWVMMDDGTIGDTSSGASTRANADTADAFAVIWAIGSAASIAILASDGTASTYGSTAADDFAAHKQITLPKILGYALAGAGAGSGLTSRTIGTTVGDETVTIAKANLPNYNLTVTGTGSATLSSGASAFGVAAGSGPSGVASGSAANVFTTSQFSSIGVSVTGTAATGGSGTPLDTMQPTSFLNVMLKL